MRGEQDREISSASFLHSAEHRSLEHQTCTLKPQLDVNPESPGQHLAWDKNIKHISVILMLKHVFYLLFFLEKVSPAMKAVVACIRFFFILFFYIAAECKQSCRERKGN